MKLVNFLFIILFLFNENCYSQDSSKSSYFKDESWAIQFRISDNFSLSSFNGKNISIKKHFNSNHSIRLAISVEGSSDNKINDSGKDISNHYRYDKIKDDALTFVLNPQYLYYFNSTQNPLLYIGFGPHWEYSDSKQDIKREDYDSNTLVYINYQNNTSNSNSLGLLMLIGVEIFVSDYISIHSEYSSIIKYYETKIITKSRIKSFDPNIIEGINKNTSKSDGWNLNWNEVLFGVSIYF